MEVEIVHRPANTAARLRLAAGETATAEAGAMIAMSGNVGITTSTHKRESGGILKAVKRVFAGESFFLNHFTAGPSGGEVWVAPSLSGDLAEIPLQKETLIVQAGSFLAAEESVRMDVGWQGFKSLFSGESLFWLRLSGPGRAVLSSFGCIYPVEVNGAYVVDTGHIAAFQETLSFSVTKAGKSWISAFLGGEFLVCRFEGRGTVWCQSHNPSSFGGVLGPMLKAR